MKTRLLLLAAILVLVCAPLACVCETAEKANVTTVGVFEVYGDGATLTGELTDMAGSERVEVWFSVKTSTADWDDTPRQTLTAPGEFRYRLTGLDQQTTYYYTAAAEGNYSGRTSYGEELDFNIAELTGG